jgi:hypothetical protein
MKTIRVGDYMRANAELPSFMTWFTPNKYYRVSRLKTCGSLVIVDNEGNNHPVDNEHFTHIQTDEREYTNGVVSAIYTYNVRKAGDAEDNERDHLEVNIVAVEVFIDYLDAVIDVTDQMNGAHIERLIEGIKDELI